MVYFLGRDVKVAISTESNTATEAISVTANECVKGEGTIIFAADMALDTFAQFTDGDGLITGMTGLDISVGATDEDITFVGQRNTATVEQKKEISVSCTRKKEDNTWEVIFNGPTQHESLENFSVDQPFGARWGLDDTSDDAEAPFIGDGLRNPKTVIENGSDPVNIGFGYRVHVQLLSGGTAGTTETMSIPNCMVSGYSVSLSPDGVDEETIEFSTQQSIKQGDTGADINNTLTDQSMF